MERTPLHTDYQSLLQSISQCYEQGRANIAAYVNTEIVNTYWQIGQYIVEFEQGGNTKATYGKGLLENLSKDLSLAYGKGFSLSNIKRMRQFYTVFPISAELPHQLNWTHLSVERTFENGKLVNKQKYFYKKFGH
jgi:hypothetical protein